jgi:hypothetical protein
MRKRMLQLFLLLSLTIGVTGLAQAQTGSFYRANIPFDFSVNGKPFKAGEYSIRFGFVGTIPNSFLIHSNDGKESAIINNTFSNDVFKPNENVRIVFDKDEDNYALAEIKTLWRNVELFKTSKRQKSARITGVEVSIFRK